jgi:hypothetical protein
MDSQINAFVALLSLAFLLVGSIKIEAAKTDSAREYTASRYCQG